MKARLPSPLVNATISDGPDPAPARFGSQIPSMRPLSVKKFLCQTSLSKPNNSFRYQDGKTQVTSPAQRSENRLALAGCPKQPVLATHLPGRMFGARCHSGRRRRQSLMADRLELLVFRCRRLNSFSVTVRTAPLLVTSSRYANNAASGASQATDNVPNCQRSVASLPLLAHFIPQCGGPPLHSCVTQSKCKAHRCDLAGMKVEPRLSNA